MDLLAQPLAETEFLAVDCETNGRAGEECELTEVGAVLVGGGELHDSFASLVGVQRPLPRGVQRLTGITQAMLDTAPEAPGVLAELARWLEGRVLVAHSASFDRRVLRQAYDRAGLPWPDSPTICTLTLARRFLPLQRDRGLGVLADALGIELHALHRALPDAVTCGRILCALLPRLRAHATTVGEAISLLAARRRPARRRAALPGPREGAGSAGLAHLDFGELPRDPGVYIFRDARGMPLYVGKSVSVASRARAHFAPAARRGSWTAHAETVDYAQTASELGALVLENRLIKRWNPPGNIRLAPRASGSVYVRCRLEDPYPVLEVGRDPAPGHAVNVGPLARRRAALELVEQLDSLFGLRHCSRRLIRREHPSAYGQMGRCLSPCLGDLDPNLYRARLEQALHLFMDDADGAERLLGHVQAEMRVAAGLRQYERAAALRRRLGRLRSLLDRVGGIVRATHARPALFVVAHRRRGSFDGFWVVEGRLRDWGSFPGCPDAGDRLLEELLERTHRAREGAGSRSLGAYLPAEEIDEVRIVRSWLAGHPATPSLGLEAAPSIEQLRDLVATGPN